MGRERDTTPDAHEAQLAALRRMGGARRVAIAADLSEGVRRITMDGIRVRHPEYDDDMVRHALYRLVLGDDLYQAAWPRRPLLAP